VVVYQVFYGSLEKTWRKRSNSFHPELLAHREEKWGAKAPRMRATSGQMNQKLKYANFVTAADK